MLVRWFYTVRWVTNSFYHGFVWVKRDDGFVTRIDPRSNKPSGQVGAYTDQQHYCQGIGAGGGAVWSCSGSNITRIAPDRMKIVASIPAGKVFDQWRLVFADGLSPSYRRQVGHGHRTDQTR
jgi:hypothetical protein